MTQISRTEYITPKTEQQIITKALEPSTETTETPTETQETIISETTLKQEAITKLTNLTDFFQKKIDSRKTRDPEKQRWARLEIEAIRTLGTLLTQHVQQDITQKVELKEDLNVTMRNYEATVLRILDRYAPKDNPNQQVDTTQSPTAAA